MYYRNVTDPFDAIADAIDAARAAWVAVEAGGDGLDGLDGLTGAPLVELNASVSDLRKRVEALHAEVAAKIARASRAELGSAGLARRQGFRTPGAMIAATTGGSVGGANRLVAVGESTCARRSLTGESLPPRHPAVAAALQSCRIGVDAAAAIISLLDRVALRADVETIAEAEALLVEKAAGLAIDQVMKLLQRAEAWLDPDGVEPREEELRADRAVHIREERSGRHLLGCASADAPTGGATVVVRVGLDQLESGVGHATVDGLTQPVSIATARRMAADGGILPCVLGGEGEILDFGRRRRLFSPAQKLAITERDGGCVGCGLPPAMTQVHHIRWWSRDRGPTDLANGVLLCVRCHHRIHDDGWEVSVDGVGIAASASLIPPAHVDHARTPRLGGRARRDYRAA